jgi:hypothetical protein
MQIAINIKIAIPSPVDEAYYLNVSKHIPSRTPRLVSIKQNPDDRHADYKATAKLFGPSIFLLYFRSFRKQFST